MPTKRTMKYTKDNHEHIYNKHTSAIDGWEECRLCGLRKTTIEDQSDESKSTLDNWRVRFERELVHKGEDGDDAPEKWAWNMRASFPIEVEKWIEFELDRTRKEERTKVLDKFKKIVTDYQNFKFNHDVLEVELCKAITRLLEEE